MNFVSRSSAPKKSFSLYFLDWKFGTYRGENSTAVKRFDKMNCEIIVCCKKETEHQIQTKCRRSAGFLVLKAHELWKFSRPLFHQDEYFVRAKNFSAPENSSALGCSPKAHVWKIQAWLRRESRYVNEKLGTKAGVLKFNKHVAQLINKQWVFGPSTVQLIQCNNCCTCREH